MKIQHAFAPILRFSRIVFLVPGLASVMSAEDRNKTPEEVTVLDPFTTSGVRTVGWNSQATLSGSRTATMLLETPQNISIFTEDFLKDSGGTNLVDILAYGASGVTQRVDFREDLMVRGFRTTPLRDGLSFGTYASITPLYDIDRIEVVKGPTAIVYSNYTTLSGTMNYVTKRPSSKPSGDFSANVGNWGTYGANVTQRGPITANKRLTYRLTSGFQQQSGWLEDEYNNNRMVSGSVDWAVNDKLQLRFDVGWFYSLSHDFGRALIDPVTRRLSTFSAGLHSSGAEFAYVKNQSERFRTEAIYELTSELNVRLLLNMYGIDYGYSVAQPFQGLKVAEAPAYKTIVERYLRFHLQDRQNDLQFDATWKKDFGFFVSRLNAGYAYNYRDNVSDPLYTATLPEFVIGKPYAPAVPAPATWAIVSNTSTSRNEGWTGYVQESVNFFKNKLIAVGGVRYVSDSATVQVGKTAIVPQVGAVFKFLPTMSVYGSYAESYTPLVGVDLIGRPLVDTVGKSKEVGLKFNTLNEHLFGTITYFDILNDPVLTPGQVINPATGLLVTGNVQTGKQTNKGVELDAGWVQPIGKDVLSLYGTVYSAKPLNELNVQPVLATKKKNSLFVKYAFGAGPLKSFHLGGGFVSTGSSPGVGFPEQPANTQYNASAGFSWKQWRIRVNGDNLTDERVIVGSSAVFSANVARPRTYKLTVSTGW